jgi:hypothetical protein
MGSLRDLSAPLALAFGVTVAACGGSVNTNPNGNADGGGGPGQPDGAPGEPDSGPPIGNGDGPFTVTSFDTHCLSTPDPDVAASPDLVATAIQWTAYFHKKDGTLDHTYVWDAHRGNLVSDTHIVWDPGLSRWFLTTIVDLGGGSFGVQIMASTDAAASNWKASVPIELPRLIDDPQPTVTSDKLVITESGPCVWALDKQKLLAGDAPSVDAITCDVNQDNQLAAVKFGTPVPTTGYAITMSDSTHLNFVTTEGTPNGGNLTATEHQITVPEVDEVPTFGGLTQHGMDIESGQVKAMWQRDHLAWSKTVRCASGSCVRLFDIDTATSTATSTDFSIPGTQLFYGGAALDKYGNAWVLMAEATPNGSVGLALGGVRASGTVEPAKIIVEGQSALSGNRFGDYFSAAQDPVDGSVWLIGQYAATNSDLNDENSAGCKVVHVTVN